MRFPGSGASRRRLRCILPLVGFLAFSPETAHAGVDAATVAKARALLRDQLTAASTKSSSTDPTYFSSGVWRNTDNSCWRCDLGPAVAGAIQQRDAGFNDLKLRGYVRESIDTAISTYQKADGSMPDPTGSSSTSVMTMFALSEIGTVRDEMLPALRRTTRQRWDTAIRAAADYLITKGELTWYSNGNLNLLLAEDLYLTWKATGDARYLEAYSDEIDFVQRPGAQFPGAGLVITRQPTRADGSDGAGYLTENGGLDWDYAQVQQDVLARLFTLTGDPRVKYLLNLITNKVMERVETRTWMLTTTGGSRHPQVRVVSYTTPALSILAGSAGRTDLASKAIAQFTATAKRFRTSMTNGWWYYNFGTQPSVVLQAVNSP
jgi:hypothetical protein